MDHPEGDASDDSGMSRYDPAADVVMGHEFCAEVVSYGPGTQRRWPTGTRVSSIPALLVPDGIRIIGQSPEAPGGFGEFFLLTEGMTQVVPTELPDELVAISDAISVGWYYASRAAITPGEIPLVIGCGAIGLAVIASLRRLGIGPIVAADFVASRRETARTMGADVVVDPAELSPYAAWRELAYGSPEPIRDVMALLGKPGSVVFECVGVPGVLDAIVMGCERGSRILSAGGPPEGDHLHTLVAKRKGLNVQFGGGPGMGHWNEAFEEVCSGRLDVTPMFGRTVGLDEVPAALDEARDAHGPARIIVVPGR
jgi:threonine dehydrogenase-like Zn-dependent dehydrogenase